MVNRSEKKVARSFNWSHGRICSEIPREEINTDSCSFIGSLRQTLRDRADDDNGRCRHFTVAYLGQ